VRCQPLCNGGHDPVPSAKPSLFSRLVIPAASIPSEKTPS
jgi:putative component of membrane protein insertase Oxa1/YidC/SpoIIIJ protein YidD